MLIGFPYILGLLSTWGAPEVLSALKSFIPLNKPQSNSKLVLFSENILTMSSMISFACPTTHLQECDLWRQE